MTNIQSVVATLFYKTKEKGHTFISMNTFDSFGHYYVT